MRFSEIDALDAELPDVGNRFDVVGGGVLYAATDKVGAYKETIAYFRPAASSLALTDSGLMNLGSLPAEWRDTRRMVSLTLENDLPFLDVEQDSTLSYLTEQMAETLIELKIERLDVSTVRGPNRLLTRAIATWAYTAVDDNDETAYSGIRYLSRFQSHECWAIFAGVNVADYRIQTIELTDPDLRSAAKQFNIKAF